MVCDVCLACGLVYDGGSLFSPDILDVTEADLLKKFTAVCDLLHSYERFDMLGLD